MLFQQQTNNKTNKILFTTDSSLYSRLLVSVVRVVRVRVVAAVAVARNFAAICQNCRHSFVLLQKMTTLLGCRKYCYYRYSPVQQRL